MKHVLLLLTFLFAQTVFCQTTFFVKNDGNGSGSSWKNASNDLSHVLSQAVAGDQIRVAAGIYKPTNSADRNASFVIPDGVHLIGGFKGYERRLKDRKAANQPTVLSGEIGTKSKTDNSYSVVTFVNASSSTILDGFEIRGGFADSESTVGNPKSSGGGLINIAEKGTSNPTIKNTIFADNFAKTGAAVCNSAVAGICSPSFFNCFFIGNDAEFAGGAIYNTVKENGKMNPEFRLCIMEGNSADYGAAVCNFAETGYCTPNFSQSKIRNNTATFGGGFIKNLKKKGTVLPTVKFCTIENNTEQSSKKNEVAAIALD